MSFKISVSDFSVSSKPGVSTKTILLPGTLMARKSVVHVCKEWPMPAPPLFVAISINYSMVKIQA